MSLKVIGAGLCRTGTSSLKIALEQLGLGPCYHMKECIANGDAARIIAIEQGVKEGQSASDLRAAFEDLFQRGSTPYQSTLDLPMALYYKELMELHPEAKVILTVRDSAEAWYKSTVSTVGSPENIRLKYRLSFVSSKRRIFYKLITSVIWRNPRTLDGCLDDPRKAAEWYTEWSAAVQAHVPADRLLVFNVKDGWPPLCKFLGVPVPDGPFPRVNEAAAVRRMIRRGNFAIACAGATAVLLLAVGFAMVMTAFRQPGASS